MMKTTGRVYLVGAGPGDPELVTLKAARLIRSCGALVYDYLVAPEILAWPGPACRRICVGKRRGFHSLPQEEIQRLLIELAREGLEVVRLKGGDPFVFGRGGEEAEALAAAGLGFEVVPGISASLGCAAYSGIPLTHRDITGAITLLSGHERIDGSGASSVDWEAHARSGATLALYMGMARLEEITARLIEGGRAPGTPAAAIEWGTTPRQRTVHARLDEIAAKVKERGLEAPAIVLIGEVARYGERLAWFGEK